MCGECAGVAVPEEDSELRGGLARRWRTKQNLDYCFLMMYAQSKGIYYVQVSTALLGAPRPGGPGRCMPPCPVPS